MLYAVFLREIEDILRGAANAILEFKLSHYEAKLVATALNCCAKEVESSKETQSPTQKAQSASLKAVLCDTALSEQAKILKLLGKKFEDALGHDL